MCTGNAKCEKTALRHIWQSYVEMAGHIRHMAAYKEFYRLRKEKMECVFADAKENTVCVTRNTEIWLRGTN